MCRSLWNLNMWVIEPFSVTSFVIENILTQSNSPPTSTPHFRHTFPSLPHIELREWTKECSTSKQSSKHEATVDILIHSIQLVPISQCLAFLEGIPLLARSSVFLIKLGHENHAVLFLDMVELLGKPSRPNTTILQISTHAYKFKCQTITCKQMQTTSCTALPTTLLHASARIWHLKQAMVRAFSLEFSLSTAIR